MKSTKYSPFTLKSMNLIAAYVVLFIGIAFVSSTDALAVTSESCIGNTENEGICKECCDCLDDASARKACRDACSTVDFTQNSDFITVDAPSSLGPNGDYSAALNLATESACKEYCDESDDLDCGDRRYCRDACNAEYGGQNPGGTDPPEPGSGDISLDQAVSDEAQRKTIAFSGLAFLTGDLCSYTFFPPGKVSDFFGFQYLRDITPNGFGHNTEFAGRISDGVLTILTDAQIQKLVDMANTQAELVDDYGYKRFVMIKAFRRLLDKDLPDGATGLDKSAVTEFTADLYEIDANISYNRADVIGGIVAELTPAQKTELDELLAAFNTLFENTGAGGTIASGDWPEACQNKVDLKDFGLTVSDGPVLVSTYAGQLFSWHHGSIEGDTYFCPERHGTYFGSFYMKDIPPLTATEPVTIDSNLTADMGQAFLDALDDTQEGLVTGLVTIQSTDLTALVAKRQEVSEKLRLFKDGTSVAKDEVVALIRQYGEYEGAMMYHYATNFATVGNTLTEAQEETVMGLRLAYYEGFSDYQANSNAYDCSGAWLYASKVAMPVIENTDFLFETSSVVDNGAVLTLVSDGFSFTEGPAADANGNLYFSDVSANRIYKWSTSGGLTVFRENSGGANGLYFDSEGNLLACEGANGQLVSITLQGNVTVIADKYPKDTGNVFNEPNDLWVDPKGGVYFSDPVYIDTTLSQDGEHVYYLTSNRENIVRVIDDMIRPNGIIGTPDGSTLFVADHGAGAVYKYDIGSDGSLSNKTLFVSKGSDGMTIDNEGNIYLTNENGVQVYNGSGTLIETIAVTDPTNVCFGGSDSQTLFITARTAVYSIRMSVKGASYSESVANLGTAISALQVMVGMEPAVTVSYTADIDGDSRVGLQEVIYWLQIVAELR